MELTEFLQTLLDQNETQNGYQIHLNSDDLDGKVSIAKDIEFSDLYFTNCILLNDSILCFTNSNRKPIAQKEDGTDLYPLDSNSNMFIDLHKIEDIEELEDFTDRFLLPVQQVVNLYMFPQTDSIKGDRNVVTVGFM